MGFEILLLLARGAVMGAGAAIGKWAYATAAERRRSAARRNARL